MTHLKAYFEITFNSAVLWTRLKMYNLGVKYILNILPECNHEDSC